MAGPDGLKPIIFKYMPDKHRALGLHCSPVGGLVQPYDGLEPGNRFRRLGLWGTIYAGPFPLGLVLVLMGDLLKYMQYIHTYIHAR